MNALRHAWNHFEEGFIAFLLAAMTLVTFAYVVVNNLYTVFYDLADRWPSASAPLFAIGDSIMGAAQAMTWSTALTKALFAWLIFFGLAYGVRVAGHIGVDTLVRLTPRPAQRVLGIIACGCCLGYAGLMAGASYEWMQTLIVAGIGAEDLGHYGLQQWHIGLIVPLGFTLVFLRYAGIFVRILRRRQIGLNLADETAEALRLAEHDRRAPEDERP
ncbi:TRAP transporter small permease [Pseudomonas sp. BN515]|uniref:TRAP transporter small permease n=1 Tax=Pseudomonas sp. BN515 TaxID=2567892 RepID=UPI002454FCBD|nr:TRAP transporter small permease [Pseudomonas sp. BN515]MDH4873862.1 TRAP transporter small permease [Pseudomonas sp. BN515]